VLPSKRPTKICQRRTPSPKLRPWKYIFRQNSKASFSRIAAERGRNTESLVFEAVERLVGQIASHDEWFPGEVEKGIAAADRGEFIEHADVRTLIDSRYPVSQRS
jgi:predicted transcriptional regulator